MSLPPLTLDGRREAARISSIFRSHIAAICRSRVDGTDTEFCELFHDDNLLLLRAAARKYPKWRGIAWHVRALEAFTAGDIALIIEQVIREQARGELYPKVRIDSCPVTETGLSRYCMYCPVRVAVVREIRRRIEEGGSDDGGERLRG